MPLPGSTFMGVDPADGPDWTSAFVQGLPVRRALPDPPPAVTPAALLATARAMSPAERAELRQILAEPAGLLALPPFEGGAAAVAAGLTGGRR